jgi:two-component system invasion response regulator UvrY
MIRIIITDDHPIFREGLKRIIEKTSDMVVADEASTGEELLGKVGEKNLDLVLLDIAMPGRGGLDILDQLKTTNPNLRILVLSMYPEERYAIRVLKSGAAGYLTKDEASDELIKAIRKISDGGKYVSPSLAEKWALDLELGGEKPLHESLSNREYQVMLMIASGKTLKEIVEELSLSVTTISTYRSRILKKMKLSNNAEIIYYAIKNGLVE